MKRPLDLGPVLSVANGVLLDSVLPVWQRRVGGRPAKGRSLMRSARALVVARLWLVAGGVAVGSCAAVPAGASAAPDDLVSGAGEVDFGTLGRVSFTGHGTATEAHGTM